MIKIIDTKSKFEVVKQEDFDIKEFYKLFLYGFDCPYTLVRNESKSDFLRFDKDGISETEGIKDIFDGFNISRDIVDYDYSYVKTIKSLLTDSLLTLDYSRDCNAILEFLIECENSPFLDYNLPAKIEANFNRALLLTMHNLKLKIDDSIEINFNRFYNYLINATLKKANHRTYKINDDVTINIEYERVFTHTEEQDTFSTVPTEMLAVKNKFKLVNLRWNECSLFDGSELALATNLIGNPSRILIVNVWYKREKRFYLQYTPFK
jgi:hypothetical protein